MNDQTSIIKRIRHDLDEIRLQFNLGKAEAIDLFEKNKEELIESIDEAKERLGQLTEPAKKKTEELRRKREELEAELEEWSGRLESAADGTDTEAHAAWENLKSKIRKLVE